ncbi:MAG TPA: ATP-binding protein [Thermoanaerobaculia bacterium]|nr:ATP-binding protein [Thermoanaerobaculia bacterium]
MSALESLVGQREGHKLEFKGREALRDRWSIGREVVAMLNAEGGEVWVGVAEHGGQAIRLEPIPHVETERSGLQDFLIDAIEPPLTHSELRVETVGKVLRIVAQPRQKAGPYSLKGKRGAVYFPVRIGERIRPMTRDEQRAAFAGEPRTSNRLGQSLKRMLDERAELQRRGGDRLSLRVLPVPSISLEGREDEIVELLQDPELTGNRKSAWVFANPFVPAEKQADGRVTSRWPPIASESAEWFRTEVRPDGAIAYEAGLKRYSQPPRGQERPEEGRLELWPLAIAELPVSMMRLAAAIYEGRLGKNDKVLADLSLLGLRGWTLRPGSSRFLGHRVMWASPEARTFQEEDLVLGDPLVFSWPEVRETPDRCGYRMVAQIYREFGYGAEAISVDIFDPATGRLLLES